MTPDDRTDPDRVESLEADVPAERLPLRKKLGLALDTLKKWFRYAEDMRRAKTPPH